MMNRWRVAIALVLLTSASAEGAEDRVDFNQDVRPILSAKCVGCHGRSETDREADLRLDDEQDAKRRRDTGHAVVAGKPEESSLYQRIVSDDEDEKMPPADSGKSLTKVEVEVLRKWIAQGATWSAAWAYVKPLRGKTPAVRDAEWPANWIDRFVLARLEERDMRPSPEADPATLLRRLSFDLTGLPPSPADVDAFTKDHGAEAYQKLVDRLLASPHYGERMAMYWLDLVRYADTVGYHGDQDHSISPYRDYVIDAFNANMPLDRFTREQLAGDLLENPTRAQRVATGYNRLLQTSHEGGVQEKEYLAIYAADRIRNVSGVWMGATMGCAQCHEHKFDPYTMKDFYSLVAFFADVDEVHHLRGGTNGLPTLRLPEMRVLTDEQQTQIAELDRKIAPMNAALGQAGEDGEKKRLQGELDKLKKHRTTIEKRGRLTMVTVSVKPRTIRVLPRGNWLDDSGDVVLPAIPDFLGKLDVGDRRPTRLDLANWLTHADGYGPLTARVFANRFWYLFFGRGIVPTLDDFGGQGDVPRAPELLDALAVEFFESGWDVKAIVKRIVMSRAYRQSSLNPRQLRERDPFNDLIARQARYRLPAEMIRDNALAISGLLVRDVNGPSVRPYQPAGYYRHLNFPKRKYVHHSDPRQWRRGVYVHWQRQFLHPMLKAFDAPSREECTPQRSRSNTPVAAMTLLNDPTFVEAARVFAAKILREGGSTDAKRITYAYRHAVSRSPDSQERKLLDALLEAGRDEFRAAPEKARMLVSTGQAKLVENLDAPELAAWTGVARAILNLNEVVTRN